MKAESVFTQSLAKAATDRQLRLERPMGTGETPVSPDRPVDDYQRASAPLSGLLYFLLNNSIIFLMSVVGRLQAKFWQT